MVSSTLDARPRHVDLLVLGSGFIGTYTVAQAREKGHSVVSTTRDGRNDTLEWSFDPLATDSSSFTTLPTAQTVLVSFPVKEKGGISKLVRFYEETHGGKTGWIYLGSTGIYEYSNERPGEPEPPGAPQPDTHHFFTRHSPYNRLNDRAQSEEELLAYAKGRATVMNLAGLWGDGRSARRFLARIITSKDALRDRKSIHMVHGEDVARGIVAVHEKWDKAEGQRWIITDGRVYDWWELTSAYGDAGVDGDGKAAHGPFGQWVNELMAEKNILALPRTPHQLGRAISSSEFWSTFEVFPRWGRVN